MTLTFDDFLYARIPAPILLVKCLRGRRVDQLVLAEIFTAERMDKMRPAVISVNELARRVGTKWEHVRDAIARLEELGFVKRDGRTLSTVAPDWVAEEFPRLLREAKRRLLVSPQRGEPTSPQRGEPTSPQRGEGVTPRGETIRSSKSGGSSNGKEKRGRPAVRTKLPTGEDPNPPASEGHGYVEIDDVNPDGESTLAAQKIEREGVERKKRNLAAGTRKATRRKTRVKRLSEDSILENPSLRPEFNSWREKDKDGMNWAPRDVIGYFVCTYRERFSRESSEFFSTFNSVRKKTVPRVAQYVHRWFNGDFCAAKAFVDSIFFGAEERGMPVKLAYFFMPSNAAMRMRLDEPVKRRAQTPVERNDRHGDYSKPENKVYWDEKVEEYEAKSRARRARKEANSG